MSTTESTPDQVETEVVIDPNAVSLTINGKTVAARKGELIIAAADRPSGHVPPVFSRSGRSSRTDDGCFLYDTCCRRASSAYRN
jgi:hypothetical protein